MIIDRINMSAPLPREFYSRNPLIVAQGLLGKKLVRVYDGVILSGMILEAEAYFGTNDSASHAYKGMTRRNAVLFGEAGHAYVYFIYGMYHMLNVVAGDTGIPWAVLIMALSPVDGVGTMQFLRGRKTGLADGPGKLCRALGIGRELNGWDLTKGAGLWIESFRETARDEILFSPRIGIDYADPEHRKAKWRVSLKKG
jgi:DNA-3-methyladenine glycosylase